MSATSPIAVTSPTALHAAVDSAVITPSDTLNLQAVKASASGNGLHLEALATGTGGNAVTLAINLPDNEDDDLVVDVTGNDTVVTLAASGTKASLDAHGILFESIVKGTDANAITVEYADPGTVSAAASVEVTGTAIKVNLATDAGSRSTLTNQGIVYTAVEKGDGGDDITIALVRPVTPNESLSVDVTGSDIVVNLATGDGTAQVETATAAGSVSSDVAQVETATAAGSVTTSGDATVTVTAAGMTNSPKAISVAVSEFDEADDIAANIRVVLAADADVAAYFTVSAGQDSDQIVLTRKAAAANDATMNIAIADGTSVGVTTAATSANTTAGLIGGGNASVVVTGAGVTGSPLTIPVAVASGDTAAQVAGKIRTVLAATAAITSLYTVGGASTSITLTRTVAVANDSTLNIAIATGTATGITTAATSANTTAGVAGAITSTRHDVAVAVSNSYAAKALVTVANPGTTTLVTALSETNLAGGGSSPFAVTTTRRQALDLLLAEEDVTDLVTVSVNDVNPLRKLADMTATALAGGSVSSTSTVQQVVNALNADTDFDGLAVATTLDPATGSEICQPTENDIELSGGVAGQWSIDNNFTRAISVAADGNLAYVPFNSSTAVTIAVKAGVTYPIVAKRVNSTNTTATGITGHI